MEVEVEFDYIAEERDELTLKQGDIVTNVSQFEEGWYIGIFNGKEGVFPDNFVRIIKPGPGHDSRPKEEDRRDRSVSSPVKVGGGGVEEVGDNIRNQMPSRALSPSTVSTNLGNKASDYVKVAYAYTPEQSDELELEVGDFIRVFNRDLPEEGWWRGFNIRTNKTGVFPDNFVKMADANDSEFKRAVTDYKMKTSSSPQRVQNSSSASSRTLQNNPATGPTGSSRRYDSDSRKRTDFSEGNPEDHHDRFPNKSPQNRAPSSAAKTTDARYSSKSDVSRSGRTETTVQKANGGSSALNRKNTTSRPEYETSSAKANVNKARSSSLTRLDPNRSSEGTPRNMSDLQSQVHEQQERLTAVANQLKKFGQTVDSIQREQRERDDNVAGQLREFNKQLSTVKTTQMTNQAGTAKNLKIITDRLRSLMLELDEVKKSRSNDAVELNRIKRVMLDLDNRAMLSSVTMNGAGEDYSAHLSDITDINGHNSCDPFPMTRSHASSKPPTGPR